MAFVPTSNVCRAEIRMTYDGQQIENTLYFQSEGGFTEERLGLVGEDLILWWNQSLAPSLVVDCQLREVYVVDLSSETAPAVTSTPPTVSTGALDTAGIAGNVALCVSFRTAARGRSARGRNYVSGTARNSWTESRIDPAIANQILIAYRSFLGTGAPEDSVWGVVSTQHNKLPRTAGLFQPITAVTLVDMVADSQRRRLPGRGR